jgi:glycosyltransferase involved in cell wall biosynthesis
MRKIKISVIIPVYNTERYIRQMLESVLSQSLKEIEILCVNDGSTDASAKILQQFQKKDKRIRIIQQEHQNAGAARNMGLKEAKGEYVIFWDADDLFCKHALKRMVQKIALKNADICICGVSEFSSEQRMNLAQEYLKTEMLPGKDPFNKFDISSRLYQFTTNVAWNKLFRREFLEKNALSFQEIHHSNDTAFVMKALYLAERITFVNSSLIYYRVDNPNSLTSQANCMPYCSFEAYFETFQYLRLQKYFPLIQDSFFEKATRGMIRALNLQNSFAVYQELYQFLQREGLEQLGLSNPITENWSAKWLEQDLYRIQTIPAEEYLFYKARERMISRRHLKQTLKRVRQKLTVPLLINQWLKKFFYRGRKR